MFVPEQSKVSLKDRLDERTYFSLLEEAGKRFGGEVVSKVHGITSLGAHVYAMALGERYQNGSCGLKVVLGYRTPPRDGSFDEQGGPIIVRGKKVKGDLTREQMESIGLSVIDEARKKHDIPKPK